MGWGTTMLRGRQRPPSPSANSLSLSCSMLRDWRVRRGPRSSRIWRISLAPRLRSGTSYGHSARPRRVIAKRSSSAAE